MTHPTTTARVLAAAVLFLVAVPASAQSHADVVQRLQEKYDAIDALRADFSMTMSSAYSPDVQRETGILTMQKERLRVDMEARTIVDDGVQTYIYTPAESQVLISDSDAEGSFSPNEFFFSYDERFNVSEAAPVTHEGEGHVQLRLEPKSADTMFSEVVLWVRDRDALITRLEVKDVNETTMVYTLEDIQLNPALDAQTFSFDPPAGVEVIDLRS